MIKEKESIICKLLQTVFQTLKRRKWKICIDQEATNCRHAQRRERESAYKRSWLNEWGGSWFCVEELKGIEEDPNTYWGGIKDGGCIVHQLGFPAIICWTKEIFCVELIILNSWLANEPYVGNEIFNILSHILFLFHLCDIYFLVCATKQTFG